MNEGYLCRDGCLDFKDEGKSVCVECVASWKEHIRLSVTKVNKDE